MYLSKRDVRIECGDYTRMNSAILNKEHLGCRRTIYYSDNAPEKYPTCPASNCNPPKNPPKRQAHSRRQRTTQVEISWKSYINCDTNAIMRMIKDDLLRWTCERHATGCLLDRHLLRDKALELAHKHGLTSTYVEGIRERRHRWNVENVVKSLVEAWQQVPRDLIIASFQRTSFRTDDCLLEIRCDAWEDLETGISFRKFVTFDDYLTANASQKQCESTSRNHNYNLRTRISKEVDKFNNLFNFAISSKEKDPIVDHALVNEISKITYEKKDIDRSHDKAQLNEELYEEAKSSNESTSRENEDIAIILTSEPSKVVDIQIESIARTSKSGDVYLTTQESVNESRTNTEYDKSTECDKTVNNEERCKNNRVPSNKRSIESPKVDNVNDDDIASQQVFDATSAVDSQSDTKESNAKVVFCSILKDEVEEADLDGNVRSSSRKSLKRRSVDESQANPNDEPERKRLRSDSDWMKQYETTFVFGPFDIARTVTTVSADTFTISDSRVPQLRPRRSCETERSIFTISPRRD
ncbi:hypothetical protein G5I_08939 [Acromyrmex echinatior]|uniref:Uncharacterized protein n=1 Tax=Acromyrmex echinatior TaxID=103372 RepID=F4WSQ8_ACREC|nr:hypothetical protein G5I_08939 [Acromyrmex echinatior]